MGSIAQRLLPHDGYAKIKGFPKPDGFQTYPGSKPETVPPGFDFGKRLSENKARLNDEMLDADIPAERRFLFMAMAMRESATLSPCERDCTKDAPDSLSTNVSIFNANKHFISHFSDTINFSKLNGYDGLYDMVRLLNGAVRKWGITKMLNFHRGGATALEKPWLPQLKPYRDAVKSTVDALVRDPALMHDERKIWIDVPWIDDKAIQAAAARKH